MAEGDQNRQREMEPVREKATEQEPKRTDEDDESEQLERVNAEGDRVDGGEQSERVDTEGEQTDDSATQEDQQEMPNEQQRGEWGKGEESPPEKVDEKMDENEAAKSETHCLSPSRFSN